MVELRTVEFIFVRTNGTDLAFVLFDFYHARIKKFYLLFLRLLEG